MVEYNLKEKLEKRKKVKGYLELTPNKFKEFIRNIIMENKAFTAGLYRRLNFIVLPRLYKKLGVKNWQETVEVLGIFEEYTETMNSYRKSDKPYREVIPRVRVTESKEELIAMYRSFSEKIGAKNGATAKQLKKDGFKYSETVFLRRFGGWKEFKEIAGYDCHLRSFYTKEEIVKNLLEARAQIGRRLSQKEIKEHPNLPSLDTVLKFFKTTSISKVWDELEIGLDKTSTEGRTYTLEEIKELLFKEYLIKGSPLTVIEIDKLSRLKRTPGPTTVYRFFKTFKIREVWKIILEEKLKNEKN
ncbi:MAG: homing endonuclease associated repeat-containing protein [Cetobacterium sp.]